MVVGDGLTKQTWLQGRVVMQSEVAVDSGTASLPCSPKWLIGQELDGFRATEQLIHAFKIHLKTQLEVTDSSRATQSRGFVWLMVLKPHCQEGKLTCN